MSDKKIIKDPIYGYIEIDGEILHHIVDTATFQRLRNIRQTSYDPLYPAAVHTRFSHSLGVYYLGSFAANYLKKAFDRHLLEEREYWEPLCPAFERYQRLFELACLLHDVGHSPFSHTGEKFYRRSRSVVEIKVDQSDYAQQVAAARTEEEKKKVEDEYQEEKRYTFWKHLAQLTGDRVFQSPAGQSPAPHEIMSCIVALEAFRDHFQDNGERAFFARCITGLQYEDALKEKEPKDYLDIAQGERLKIRDRALQNCFIQLLHSSVIDVDRLDYIIRDAATIGYQSVSVDYVRLLKGVNLVRSSDYGDVFTIGFHKSAISVIENAVYAHDIEKKWVQGHPAILYDSFLLDRSIQVIEDDIHAEQSTLFSFDSLTESGSHLENHINIRYLCDGDLLHLMKSEFWNEYSKEYFKRDIRPVPMWKSEAEFRSLFDSAERKDIGDAMLLMGVFKSEGNVEIDDRAIEKLNGMLKEKPENHVCERTKRLIEKILELCDRYGIRRRIVILSASAFISNFYKNSDKVREIPIIFPDTGKTCLLKEVSTTLSSEAPGEEKLYYFYYYPKEGRRKIDTAQFSKDLADIFRDNKIRVTKKQTA